MVIQNILILSVAILTFSTVIIPVAILTFCTVIRIPDYLNACLHQYSSLWFTICLRQKYYDKIQKLKHILMTTFP